ncbi:FecCD family ABC transporter permease [Salipaludibacillus sp. HK11]|uniref:FecCD family ABC transporter permease n=1 Tax=Salipaludibacillus sp. HK11 TaxID=3394320 RepID=UPI0039FC50BF
MKLIHHALLILIGLTIVTLLVVISISFGIADINLKTVYQSFFNFNGSREHLIIFNARVPRAVIAMMVGSCLAVAGTIMQALTRNALAAPEILGVNHGAALFVVISIFLFDMTDPSTYTWFAFAGAGIVATVVYLLSSMGREGMTPLRLILAGAAMTTLMSSLIQGIMIVNQQSLDNMRFWLAGSVVGRDLSLFMQILPYMMIGLVVPFFMSKQLTILSLGEETAVGLGQKTKAIKTISIIIVVLLAGSSVAIAGPIGFVGLAVPHIARSIVGTDYKWIIPYSAILGAILVLLADITARFVLNNQELPVGVMTAMVGVPFFIYLARKKAHKL